MIKGKIKTVQALIKAYQKRIVRRICYVPDAFASDVETKNLTDRNEIEIECLYSSIIAKVKINGVWYYYRFCFEHTDMSEYVRRAIQLFKYISIPHDIKKEFSPQMLESFCSYAVKCTYEKGFAKKIHKVSRYLRHKGDYPIWFDDKWENLNAYDMSALGYSDMPDIFESIVPFFLHYMLVVTSNYHKNHFLGNGLIEHFSYSQFKATFKMAEYLGVSNLVVKPSPVLLRIEKFAFWGFACESVDDYVWKSKKYFPSSGLQKQLNQLNLLDVITHELDHGPNNYGVKFNGGGYSLCAFDNDCPDTFALSANVNIRGAFEGSPFIKNGMINRPYLDEKMVKRILEIRKKDLHRYLHDSLAPMQIYFVWRRLNRLKKYLSKSIKKGVVLLLNEQWNEATIQEELSNKYGRTYLRVYCEKCV